MFKCPKCGGKADVKIGSSYYKHTETYTIRTRQCLECGYSFKTVETYSSRDLRHYLKRKGEWYYGK